jgi:predicted PurR-regulated permease PerM
MSTAATLTVFITVSVAFLGTTLGIVYFFGQQLIELSRRIDQSEERMGRRIEMMDVHIQELRQDVALLKATH